MEGLGPSSPPTDSASSLAIEGESNELDVTSSLGEWRPRCHQQTDEPSSAQPKGAPLATLLISRTGVVRGTST